MKQQDVSLFVINEDRQAGIFRRPHASGKCLKTKDIPLSTQSTQREEQISVFPDFLCDLCASAPLRTLRRKRLYLGLIAATGGRMA
jgi:hypothetical protein